MHFTDLFIRRPVLAIVLNLLILVIGIRSIDLLPIRQYPYMQNAVITVTTAYVGADPALIAGFITQPLENSIAQANGIDYLSSSSMQGTSIIKATLRLNYDPNKALTEINTKVNAVLNQLPKEAQQPTLSIAIGDSIDSMYIGFYSNVLPSNKITDYLIRVVQPKLQAVEGVQQAEILGMHQFAMRAWLDPDKMAAYALSSSDVANALAANHFIAAVGRTDGDMITVNLTANTGLHTTDEFKNLVITAKNGAFVRLGDVANITLGSDDYDTSVSFDGKKAVYIGIQVAPSANLLTVIKDVRKIFPDIEKQLPGGLSGKVVYDATKFVESSITEVEHSLFEALLIVTIVIALFLGSLRSIFIPVIAIPLSLVGTFFIMLMFGFSINLLTLLAFVLAIGLVVDDAIIVVENVHRHMEEGMSPLEAALVGTRELAMPIIAISVVLIAVYLPIGFMGGLTGTLFTEFAFTLAGAVGISAIIALTLSPMMCSKMMVSGQAQEGFGRFAHYLDQQFDKLKKLYQRSLHRALNYVPVILMFGAIILASIYFLFITSKTELAPQEDQGVIISLLTAPPNATLKQTALYSKEVYRIMSSYPETDHVFQLDGINGLNSSIGGMVLVPWEERKRLTNQLQPDVQKKMVGIAGANVVVFQPAPLPGAGGGLPVQFVIGTTESFDKLNEVSQIVLQKAVDSHLFMFIDTDLKYDKPQAVVNFNRDKAALLGLNMKDIGNVLVFGLGGNYINYFDLSGRSYKVIPQMKRADRFNYNQLLDYYITMPLGDSVSLSTFSTVERRTAPQSLNHFQQLNSATISAVPFPGISMGQALEKMQEIANENLPQDYSVDYTGQSRQYMQEGDTLVLTFVFALIIIFLSLAALFESFRDPIIVLVSVPMSIAGAMIFISMGIGGVSLNIYTEVGLVTLIGLISKHGILIVQFANDLQREGKKKREALELAAATRLRPILMTTAAMVLGVLPLIMATGAGAASRFNIGLVIVTGISIGTLFTLFVLPGVYIFLARDHSKDITQVT